MPEEAVRPASDHAMLPLCLDVNDRRVKRIHAHGPGLKSRARNIHHQRNYAERKGYVVRHVQAAHV